MSRPAPKFSMGEEVLVIEGNDYADDPLYGGEGIIMDIQYYSGYWRYHVEGYNAPDHYCGEKWLRKKPRPSTKPFDQIMEGLKRPMGVEA